MQYIFCNITYDNLSFTINFILNITCEHLSPFYFVDFNLSQKVAIPKTSGVLSLLGARRSFFVVHYDKKVLCCAFQKRFIRRALFSDVIKKKEKHH